MKTKTIQTLTCAVALTGIAGAATAEDIVIGVPNWPSVQATAHILEKVMEDRLELDVTLKDGGNEAVFRGMDAGTIHVHPEAWLPNLAHLKRRYVDGKKSIRMTELGATGTQAMCVTKGTAERTGIKSIKELTDPAMAAKFDRDGDGKGDVWIGADGWGSTPIERIRARSYGYDDTMTLIESEEAKALADVDAAVKADQNIAFFCYTPHHMFAANELVVLEEPEYDATQWVIVPPSPTPGWLEKSTAAVAWEDATLNISYAAGLADAQPKATAMLEKVSLSTEELTEMTFALAVEKQDPAEFAAKWVEANAAKIDSWLE